MSDKLKAVEMYEEPLVSIGIPTYNRSSVIGRAVESALNQVYANLEIIISDNNSTDDTQKVCEGYANRDQRVRYIQQSDNIGATRNFQAVLQLATGQFFMWLADDDWLDANYITECVNVLLKHPDFAAVCGSHRYYEDDKLAFEIVETSLLQERGSTRIVEHFRTVKWNGIIYGVMRKELLDRVNFRNMLGGDWLVVAGIVFQGRVEVLSFTAANRMLGGTSKSIENLIDKLNLAKPLVHPFLGVAAQVFKEIAWQSDVYATMKRLTRMRVGVKCALIIVSRYYVFDKLNRAKVNIKSLNGRFGIRTRIRKVLKQKS